MKKKFIVLSSFIFSILYSTPLIALAQVTTTPNINDANFIGPRAPASFFCKLGPKFQDLLAYVTCIISTSVVPLIFALALVMFVWGVVQYVINSDEEAKKAKGKQFMIWGIIALAVMVSVWGLVRILGNTFGIEYAIPQVKSQ